MIFNGKQLTVFGHIQNDSKEEIPWSAYFDENGQTTISAPEGKTFSEIVVTVDVDAGVDTSDANATAEDIAQGKTAYVNGKKVAGAVADIRGKSLDAAIGDSEMVDSAYGLHLAFTIDDVPSIFDLNTQFLLNATDIANTAGLTADMIVTGNTVLGIAGTAEKAKTYESAENKSF